MCTVHVLVNFRENTCISLIYCLLCTVLCVLYTVFVHVYPYIQFTNKLSIITTIMRAQCTGGSTRASGACRWRRSWRSRRACRTTSRVPSAACSSTRGARSSATCSRCAPLSFALSLPSHTCTLPLACLCCFPFAALLILLHTHTHIHLFTLTLHSTLTLYISHSDSHSHKHYTHLYWSCFIRSHSPVCPAHLLVQPETCSANCSKSAAFRHFSPSNSLQNDLRPH